MNANFRLKGMAGMAKTAAIAFVLAFVLMASVLFVGGLASELNDTLNDTANDSAILNETFVDSNYTYNDTGAQNITDTAANETQNLTDNTSETIEPNATENLTINTTASTAENATQNLTENATQKARKFHINFNGKDANGNAVNANYKIFKDGSEVSAQLSGAGTESSSGIDGGNYDVEMTPESGPVKKILFHSVKLDGSDKTIGVDDTPESAYAGSSEVFAIDPTAINFTTAEVTATAKGDTLYKCKEWDFETRACGGEWANMMALMPGQDFTFILTPDDPAYAETWQPDTMLKTTEFFINNTATQVGANGWLNGTFIVTLPENGTISVKSAFIEVYGTSPAGTAGTVRTLLNDTQLAFQAIPGGGEWYGFRYLANGTNVSTSPSGGLYGITSNVPQVFKLSLSPSTATNALSAKAVITYTISKNQATSMQTAQYYIGTRTSQLAAGSAHQFIFPVKLAGTSPSVKNAWFEIGGMTPGTNGLTLNTFLNGTAIKQGSSIALSTATAETESFIVNLNATSTGTPSIYSITDNSQNIYNLTVQCSGDACNALYAKLYVTYNTSARNQTTLEFYINSTGTATPSGGYWNSTFPVQLFGDGIVVKNAFVEVDGGWQGTASTLTILLNKSFILPITAMDFGGGESNGFRVLANGTNVTTLSGGGLYSINDNTLRNFNLSVLCGGSVCNALSAKAVITYEFTAEPNQTTVQFYVNSSPVQIAAGGGLNTSFTVRLPEDNTSVQSAFFEDGGNMAGTSDMTTTATLGATAIPNDATLWDSSGANQPLYGFRAMYNATNNTQYTPYGITDNTSKGFMHGIGCSGSACNNLNSKLIMTYELSKRGDPPKWYSQSQNTSTPEVNDPLYLSANWTDENGLSYAVLSTNETGAWQNKTTYGSPMALSGLSQWSNFTWQNASVTGGTTVGWKIYANNSRNMWNVTNIMNFTVRTDNPPTVNLTGPANGNTTTLDTVNFTCNATDDKQLSNITLYWNYGGTWAASTGINISGTANQTNFTKTSLNNGAILWNCKACDNVSQCSYATANWTVTVNRSTPIWSNLTANMSPAAPGTGRGLMLSTYWSDIATLSTATLETNETGAFQNKTNTVSLVSAANWSNFTWQNTSLKLGATVAWKIWSNDTNGYWNATPYQTFAVSGIESPNGIESCMELNTSGTCTLSNIIKNDSVYEDVVISTVSPPSWAIINASLENVTIPSNAEITNAQVCVLGYRDSILGNAAGDQCSLDAGENSSGTNSWTNALFMSQQTCLNWSSVSVSPNVVCGNITDWLRNRPNPAAAANSLNVSWYGLESSDNLADFWLDWAYANITWAEDGQAPRWLSQAENNSVPSVGDTIILSVQWSDDYSLDKATLQTNETGVWLNKTANYSSPLSLGRGTGNWSNFTWKNASTASNTIVGWRVYANDTAGNQNVTANMTFSLTGDNVPPQITITSPINKTYGTNSTWINATTNEAASGCNRSIDGGANVIMNSTATTSWYNLTSVSEGPHNVTVYCNDITGNKNASDPRIFTVDTKAPLWSGNVSSIPNNYSATNSSKFNITWNDATSGTNFSLLEGNWTGIATNYTMFRYNATTFGYNETLPKGTFYWKSYSNDSIGNWNVTDAFLFSITGAFNDVSLTINNETDYTNQNVSTTYPTETITTGTANTVAALWRNETSVGNPDIQTLGAGTYIYKVNATAVGNYSANASGLSYYLFVSQAQNIVNLTLNGQQGNISVVYGTGVTPISGGPDGISLSNNDTAAASGTTYYLAVGYYAFKANSTGNANYTANATGVTYYANVTQTSTAITLNQPANGANALPKNITFNFTALTTLNSSLNCNLSVDNTVSGSNSSVANNTLTGIRVNNIAEGTHSWNVTCTDASNVTNTSDTLAFTVNVTPALSGITASPSPVKGGSTVTITASGVEDPNNNTIYFYCADNPSPTYGNTSCSGGSTVGSYPYSSVTCTFAAPADSTSHTEYCGVTDLVYSSSARNATYTTDSTPPTTSITSVDGTTVPPYYDNVNDGWTNISVSGESNMQCRWSTANVSYGTMSNNCTLSGSNALCSPSGYTQGAQAFYVGCADSLGNEQPASQDLNASAILDWTAPTTYDNSTTTLSLPNYIVSLTEQDNIFTANLLTTMYCVSPPSAVSCTPNTAITTGQILNFTTRGQNVLRYNSTDPAGNWQAIQNKTISIKQLPIFTSGQDNATLIRGGGGVRVTTVSYDPDGQNLTLVVCNTTGIANLTCAQKTYCTNATASANSSCAWTAEAFDGTHYWYAFLYDSFNESASANFSDNYTTDSTPPSITINAPTSTSYSYTAISADITLSEAAASAWYIINDTTNFTLSNDSTTHWYGTLSGLSNGTFEARFYANDSLNNVGTNSVVFSVDTSLNDTVPPTVTVSTPANGTITGKTYLLVNVTLNKPGLNSTYNTDNGNNNTMDRIDTTHFGANITGLSEGWHNVTFFSNISSGATGTNNISFAVDLTAPQYTNYGYEPSSPADNTSVTCWAHWTDNIALSNATLFEDITGGSHVTQLNGTQGWTNYTFTVDLLTTGVHQCIWQAKDKPANSNSTPTIQFTVAHVSPPEITNVSYSPTAAAQLYPGATITVTANVTEKTVMSKVLLRYRESGGSWSETEMSNTVGNLYSGTFTPNTENTWTFKVFANDSSGNSNESAETNVTIAYTRTWNNTPTSLGAVSGLINTNASLGTITINNTGNANITFEITTASNAFFNVSMPFTLQPNETAAIAVNATTGSTTGQENIILTITALNTSTPQNATVNATLASYVSGPYLYVSIETAPSAVTQGDSSINLLAKVKNIGNSTASNTWLAWSLPSKWSIASGSQNASIGTLGVGQSATNGMVVSVGSDATTGTQTLLASAGSSETTGSASKSVTVSSTGGGTIITETVAGSVGFVTGGGGTGAAQPDIRIVTPSSTEILIGKSEAIVIGVTNTNGIATLKNVTLKTSGFLSQYVTVEPPLIDVIYPNQTKYFTVTVKAPTYMSDQTVKLGLTTSGYLVNGPSESPVSNSASVNLLIHTITTGAANVSLLDAEGAIRNMTDAGFNVGGENNLLTQAKAALDKKDLAGAKKLADEILRLEEKAFTVNNGIKDLESKITDAVAGGRETTESTKALGLAKEAFGRGDYDLAESRLSAASLTFTIESQRINAVQFLLRWWWAVIIASAIVSFLAISVRRELIMWNLTRRLAALHEEEKALTELMTRLQKEYYKERTVPKLEFYRNMYEYEKRLEKVRESIAKLTTEKVKMVKVTEELSRLELEDKKIKELIISLQHRYFEEGKVTKDTYMRQMRAYTGRRAEIAQNREAAKARLKYEEKRPYGKTRKHAFDAYNRFMSALEKIFRIWGR